MAFAISADSTSTGQMSIDIVTIADGQRRTVIEDGYSPAWSPDGRDIAYLRNSQLGGTRGAGVWVAAADGINSHQVTTSLIAPAWSPDGSLLVGLGEDGLFSGRPDGTARTVLTPELRPGTFAIFGQVPGFDAMIEADGVWGDFGPHWQSLPLPDQ